MIESHESDRYLKKRDARRDPKNTDELGMAESHGRGGERKRFLRIIINGRTGLVQMILLLSVLQWELTTQQLFRRLAFYARAIPVGKQAPTTHAEVHRTSRSLQCNRFVEIIIQLVPSDDDRTISRKFYDALFNEFRKF